MNDTQMTRITIQIRKDLKQGFIAFTRKFGISKDHFLRSQLPKEIEYLKQLPANTTKGRTINRELGGGTERLNISLTKDLAREMDRVCEKKGQHREIFLHYYLDYLLNGDEEFDFPSPIMRLEELLDNVRDRRTLSTSLIMGPIFGPILFSVVINLSIERSRDDAQKTLELPVIGAEHGPNLVD